MATLVDTNILLRSAQPSHPLCIQATQAVANLLRRRETIFFCPQNVAEFWHVATRHADHNGLGMSHDEALAEVRNIEDLLTLLPDSPAVYPEWKRIVKDYKVMGVKVYDARLVAIMNVYGMKSILTYNTADFARYPHLAVLDPSQV
jgi:predicted nucleic acid-binding protein